MSYPGSSRGEANYPADPRAGRPGQNMPPRVQLSEAELGVLAECKSESFYYRSLPFATLAAVGTLQLIRMGYLTTGRFGQAPKIGFAIFSGYLAGKISYIDQCKKKFMKLENSQIGEMLRKGKNIGPGTFGGMASSVAMDADDSNDDLNATNIRPNNDPHVNLDIDTSTLPSLDDKMDRPETLYQLDNDDLIESQLAKPKATMTYDELRKRNREQGSRGRMSDHFDSKKSAPSNESGAFKQPSKSFEEDTGFSKSVRSKVNTYGDSWDDE